VASSETANVAEAFLLQTEETDPLTLFRLYAQYLLRSSNTWKLPVSLDRVRDRHGFRRRTASLDLRGFLFGDEIFINSDDATTVQRFTEAHEMMESLVVALRSEDPPRLAAHTQQELHSNKEDWCEQGAAEFLMPAELFFPLVVERGLSLATGRQLASLCQTSLTATIRRMLDADIAPCIFALLKEGFKKSQQVPSKVGQGVLWGDPADWDPPAELRVWKRWSSPQVKVFLCWNESFSRDTSIYHTLRAGNAGEIRSGHDMLDLEYIKGSHYTESMLVIIDDTPVVMALIHL
jgi:hypothetical protein